MNYYNEHDPKAAAWLRVLISEGLIAPGDVDERDIQDVTAGDVSGYIQCHFFAGIGGWSLALRLAGWPDDKPVWTGSCPCQPFSDAGEGMGFDDERHLWPDFRNLIGQCGPSVVFGEQVASKLGREWLAGVRADMERAAYAFGAADLCAAGVGAPHKRQRFFWVAHTKNFDRRSKFESRESSADGWRRSSGDSGISSMADSTSMFGPKHEREQGQRLRRVKGPENATECGGNINALGNSKQPGLQEQRSVTAPSSGKPRRITAEAARYGNPVDATGFWSDYRIIQTRDGKNRRIPVEPAFFPLVDGFPARVAVLKGFGNAIVPALAAQFIQAAEEVIALNFTPP